MELSWKRALNRAAAFSDGIQVLACAWRIMCGDFGYCRELLEDLRKLCLNELLYVLIIKLAGKQGGMEGRVGGKRRDGKREKNRGEICMKSKHVVFALDNVRGRYDMFM